MAIDERCHLWEIKRIVQIRAGPQSLFAVFHDPSISEHIFADSKAKVGNVSEVGQVEWK